MLLVKDCLESSLHPALTFFDGVRVSGPVSLLSPALRLPPTAGLFAVPVGLSVGDDVGASAVGGLPPSVRLLGSWSVAVLCSTVVDDCMCVKVSKKHN